MPAKAETRQPVKVETVTTTTAFYPRDLYERAQAIVEENLGGYVLDTIQMLQEEGEYTANWDDDDDGYTIKSVTKIDGKVASW